MARCAIADSVRFDEWYQRGHALAAERGENKLWLFEEDWYPDGVEAYRRMKRNDATMKAMYETRALTATADGPRTTGGRGGAWQ